MKMNILQNKRLIFQNINFILNQNSVQASKNPYEIYRTGVFNKQTLARLTYYRTINPKFSVEVGPMYKMFNRVKIDTVDSPYMQVFSLQQELNLELTGIYHRQCMQERRCLRTYCLRLL